MPDKPSKAEDEYFARKELERRKAQAAKIAEGEKQRLKELHYMKCPKCGMDLAEIELHSVKVDECATCGGVFFDAGEIEQMLDNKAAQGVLSKVVSAFR